MKKCRNKLCYSNFGSVDNKSTGCISSRDGRCSEQKKFDKIMARLDDLNVIGRETFLLFMKGE